MDAFLRKLARRRALLGAGTLLGGLPARQGQAALGRLMESAPKPLPAFGFTDGEGRPHTLAEFVGRGVLINLWATWCPPCVAEMPALDRAQAALEDDGVVVLALSSDRGGRAMVQPFYERVGIRRLGLWLDPGGAAQRALGSRGLPTSLVIDRAGKERARLEGAAEWDSPELLGAVRRLVAPARAAAERRA
jgi:thiol-disulfide isomerase/thioredoxin